MKVVSCFKICQLEVHQRFLLLLRTKKLTPGDVTHGKIMGVKDEGQLSCYKYQGLTLSLLSTDTNTTMQIHSSSNHSRITQTHTVNTNDADDKDVLTHIHTIDAACLIS
jgi:hypothetical protein